MISEIAAEKIKRTCSRYLIVTFHLNQGKKRFETDILDMRVDEPLRTGYQIRLLQQ